MGWHLYWTLDTAKQRRATEGRGVHIFAMDNARILGLVTSIKRLDGDLLKAKDDVAAAARALCLAEAHVSQINNHPDTPRALAAVDSFNSTRAGAKASNAKAMCRRLEELERNATLFLELIERKRKRERERAYASRAYEGEVRRCGEIQPQLADMRQQLERITASLSLPTSGLPQSGSFDECVTNEFREELSALCSYTADFESKFIGLRPELIASQESNAAALGERLGDMLNQLRERIQAMERVREFERKLIRREEFRVQGEGFVGPFRTELTATWAANQLAKAQGRSWTVKPNVEPVGAWAIRIWNVVEAARPEDRHLKGRTVLNLGGLRAENAQRGRN